MGDWKITGKEKDVVDSLTEMVTLGFAPAPTIYEVTNTETGEVKHVTAYSEEGLGRKIADGKFNKD
jgi:hypothetical protein